MNAAYLREQKEKLKISYDEIAKRSGVSRRACIGILNEEEKFSNPTQASIQALENALEITQKEKPPELSDGEKALLELFNQVPADKQALVLEMIRVALKSQE